MIDQKKIKYALTLERYANPNGGILVCGERFMSYWGIAPFPIDNRDEAHRVLSAGISKLLDCKVMDLWMPKKVRVVMNEGEEPVARPVWI